MNLNEREWDGRERRAVPHFPRAPQHPQPWRIVEPDESMCPVYDTTTPPEHYEEVMKRLARRMGKTWPPAKGAAKS